MAYRCGQSGRGRDGRRSCGDGLAEAVGRRSRGHGFHLRGRALGQPLALAIHALESRGGTRQLYTAAGMRERAGSGAPCVPFAPTPHGRLRFTAGGLAGIEVSVAHWATVDPVEWSAAGISSDANPHAVAIDIWAICPLLAHATHVRLFRCTEDATEVAAACLAPALCVLRAKRGGAKVECARRGIEDFGGRGSGDEAEEWS